MTEAKKQYAAKGGQVLMGGLRVPGDKSISHRAVMLGALARGRTEINGFLAGADALSTCEIFRAMGVTIDGPVDGHLVVHGVGVKGLRAPAGVLDCGNAGTAMRLIAGVMAGQPFASELTGDASLQRRPMRRVIAPLTAMGAKIDSRDGLPPLRITPAGGLHGIHYDMPVASAQVKSAILLAGLFASGETRVTEPAPTRDHTERMLAAFGVTVQREGAAVTIAGGQPLTATRIDVPADVSSAAFFMVAASITPGSDIILEHVGINPTRIGILHILTAMGADITLLEQGLAGDEPVADIRVRHAPLHGITIDPAWVPLAIDEFPVVFVAAACATGRTVLTGAEELRVKESDRIAVMAQGLQALGVQASATADGMIIEGVGEARPAFTGGRVDSHGDHRIAMAFAVASLRASDTILIDDTRNVATSFPGFTDCCARLGLTVLEVDTDAADPAHG